MDEEVRQTLSVCPECLNTIPAKIVKRGNELFIVKECPEHGKFEELYWADYELYKKFMSRLEAGKGIENPKTDAKKGCPWDCGLCPLHMSSSVLVNIDITNRCNFRCPICFANAAATGKVWDLSIEEVSGMIDNIMSQRPPALAVQFSGGEPTVRDDLPDMIKLAKEKGIKNVMIATNGARLAEDFDYLKSLVDAGLSVIYLQFDGVSERPYQIARGFNAFPLKKKVIENVRRIGKPNVVLVPTVVKGVNDHEAGDIIRFAAENSDVVRGIAFQPVAITGRIRKEEREKMRITIPELLDRIEEQTGGQIRKKDFYTIPSIFPIIEWLRATADDGSRYPYVRTHPVCGAGTYVFVDGDKLVPITRVINVDRLISLMEKKISRTEMVLRLPTVIKPGIITRAKDFLSVLKGIVTEGSFSAAASFHNIKHLLFIGTMHFQDPYNFDVERVMRCVIHYALPDGKVIPFCAYNNFYRQEYEAKFARDATEEDKRELNEQVKKLAEWRREFG